MYEKSQSLYMQVSEKIFQSIRNGEYSENSPLPTEQTLGDKYHVSRNTIRLAIQNLKDRDIVFTVKGTGTFICPQVFTQSLSKFYSFTDSLKSSNILIQNSIVSCETVFANKSMAKKTRHPEGAAFHKLLRLRSASEYPLMLETTYLPISRFISLDLDVLSKGSLYEFLRNKYSLQADKATETFRPVMPHPEEKICFKYRPAHHVSCLSGSAMKAICWWNILSPLSGGINIFFMWIC